MSYPYRVDEASYAAAAHMADPYYANAAAAAGYQAAYQNCIPAPVSVPVHHHYHQVAGVSAAPVNNTNRQYQYYDVPPAANQVAAVATTEVSHHHHQYQQYSPTQYAESPINIGASATATTTVVGGNSGLTTSYDSAFQQRSQSQQQVATTSGTYQQQSSSGGHQHQQQQSSYTSGSTTAQATTASTTVLSQVEQAILRSNVPIDINETEEITVNGQRGIWANKQEVVNWRGPVPVSQYAINEDPNPEIITKRTSQQLEYIQELAIRYLRPPTPPAPGEIIITQEVNSLTPPAPPLIIRQQPPRPTTPEPLVIREAPPQPPSQVGRKVITISGKRLPPPPRKVIIERLAPLPSKPQSVIVERWLPYSQVKRRVIFQRSNERDPVIMKPRNVVIQWEAPRVNIKKEIKYLGVIRANPVEYVQRYGTSLKTSRELPDFVLDIKTPEGIVLAADYKYNTVHELEGEVAALKLVDLDREGLSEYRSYLQRLGISYVGAQNVLQAASQLNTSNVNISSTQQTYQETTTVVSSTSNGGGATASGYEAYGGSTATNNGHSQYQQYTTSGSHQQPQQQQDYNYTTNVSGSYENSAQAYGYGAPPVNPHNTASSQQRSGSERAINAREVIADLFASIDRDRSGRMTYDEAERLLLRLNSKLNRSFGEHDVRAFFQTIDLNRDGSIDLKEFRAAFERQL